MWIFSLRVNYPISVLCERETWLLVFCNHLNKVKIFWLHGGILKLVLACFRDKWFWRHSKKSVLFLLVSSECSRPRTLLLNQCFHRRETIHGKNRGYWRGWKRMNMIILVIHLPTWIHCHWVLVHLILLWYHLVSWLNLSHIHRSNHGLHVLNQLLIGNNMLKLVLLVIVSLRRETRLSYKGGRALTSIYKSYVLKKISFFFLVILVVFNWLKLGIRKN